MYLNGFTDMLSCLGVDKKVDKVTPNPAQVSLKKKPRQVTTRTYSTHRPKVQKKKALLYQGSQAALRNMGNSATNPIDIDAIYSRFEPTAIKEYVSFIFFFRFSVV